jgi:hypothetical protein
MLCNRHAPHQEEIAILKQHNAAKASHGNVRQSSQNPRSAPLQVAVCAHFSEHGAAAVQRLTPAGCSPARSCRCCCSRCRARNHRCSAISRLASERRTSRCCECVASTASWIACKHHFNAVVIVKVFGPCCWSLPLLLCWLLWACRRVSWCSCFGQQGALLALALAPAQEKRQSCQQQRTCSGRR